MHIQESQSKIKLLPEHIIDQIKAGEVIERPASLVKELLENALDAKATKLSLHLINNGLELLEISDNGMGMSFHDLPLAFCRHATSKISRFEELYSLYSYGFRGEALASMASVAKVQCTSLQDNHQGGKLSMNGGEMLSHVEHIGHERGTSFYIKDLFYNTPARLKFIKSKTAEKNALLKVIHGFLLNYPEVSFKLKWDDKEKEIYPAETRDQEGLQKRLRDLYFKKNYHTADFAKNILSFHQSYHQSSLSLSMLDDEVVNSGSKCQYILVNGRQIQDKQIHSLLSYFADKLGPKIYSHYFLSLTINPEDLDVNVHPNKLFVKFHNAGEIMGLLSSTLKAHEKKYETPAAHIQEATKLKSSEFHFDHNFSLKDLKDKKESTPLTLEEEMAVATMSRLSIPLFISADFCLKESVEGYQLIQVSLLMKHYLMSSLSVEDAIPLMISEPIPWSKSDQMLPALSSIGFELDRLNAETLALRAMPMNFEKVNTRDWFKDFLLFFHSQKELSAKNVLNNFLEKKMDRVHYERELMIEVLSNYEIAELQNIGCARPLSPEFLAKIFSL